jgi:hypothetical protein
MSSLQLVSVLLFITFCQVSHSLIVPTCYEGGTPRKPGEEWLCSDGCTPCSCVLGKVVKASRSPDCVPTLKSCRSSDGTIVPHGETYNNGPCVQCQCYNGQPRHCIATMCPKTLCDNPVRQPGQCCAICSQSCQMNGKVFQHGQIISLFGPCFVCSCYEGHMTCNIRDCAAPDCDNYYVPEGQCCPVCSSGPRQGPPLALQ